MVGALKSNGIRDMWGKVVRTIRNRLRRIFDYYFDFKYGTDTAASVSLAEFSILSQNKTKGIIYQPASVRPLIKLLGEITFPGNQNTFVDVGSGKGKVVLVAALFNFTRVVGIEFSKELCEIARRNVSIFKSRTDCKTPMEIFHTDALEYNFYGDESIFYMANPFDGYVMEKFLSRLKEYVLRKSGRIFLLYQNPVCRDVVEGCGYLELYREFHSCGAQILVYTST